MTNAERAEQLQEIKDDFIAKLELAAELIKGTPESIEYNATFYWLSPLRIRLDENHKIFGAPSRTMQETIDLLKNAEN